MIYNQKILLAKMTIEDFKRKHGHEEKGIWYPRVTSICEIIAKPGMEKWLADSGSYDAMKQKRKKILNWGTSIDLAVKKILRGQNPEINTNINPSIEAFLNWLKQHKVVLFDTDRKVISKKHIYSGTADIIAEIDGTFGILDIKTSSNFWDEHFLQTAAYCQAFNEEELKKVKTHWILRVDQYQECKNCRAQKREKGGDDDVKRNNKYCSHNWSDFKGVCELKETTEPQTHIKMFLHAKKLWELANRRFLSKISNYPNKI
jgi:hypothetical protein